MIIINAIIPVFGIILVGAIAAKFKILGSNADKQLSSFVYFIALPSTLFLSGATTPLKMYVEAWPFAVAFGLSTLIMFILMFMKKNKNKHARVINALSVASPNVAFMGIPVMLVLFGRESMLEIIIATIFFIAAVIISVIMLDSFNSEHLIEERFKIARILCKNPLLIAIIAGMLFSAFKITLPKSIYSLFNYFSATTGPLALFAIGTTITLRIPVGIPHLFLVSFMKLIIMPIITFILLIIFGGTPLMKATGLVISCLPVAVTSFILAQKYETNIQETSDIVISSTIFSVITLSIVIAIVSALYPSTLIT